jgi:hypothetical protein
MGLPRIRGSETLENGQFFAVRRPFCQFFHLAMWSSANHTEGTITQFTDNAVARRRAKETSELDRTKPTDRICRAPLVVIHVYENETRVRHGVYRSGT